MHYEWNAFSKSIISITILKLYILKIKKYLDGQATIIPKNNMYPQSALTPAYQKTALSNIDVEEVRKYYNCV
jgi:hypothetical protein